MNAHLIIRLLLSLVYGGLIGIERQWHHKNAGLKTNTLVAVGATAFALVSEMGYGPGSNPVQIAAGVVTGIGFIGGGVIMRRGGSVQGINSAATLWATASVGLSLGGGYYTLATAVLITVLAAQSLLRHAAGWIDRRSGLIQPLQIHKVTVEFADAARIQVHDLWSGFSTQSGVSITGYTEEKEGGRSRFEAVFGLSELRAGQMGGLMQNFGRIPEVNRAEWTQSTLSDNE